jgi:hypothetical protein
VAAEDDNLFKSCAVICSRLRQDRNLEWDGERKHKTEQDNHAFEHHVASPESMDKR